MYSNGQAPGDAEGQVHPICTNKNVVSPVSGGPWTPLCEEVFSRAGLSLDDVANKVGLGGHQGPHPREYHQAVLDRLQKALGRCKTEETCRGRLMEELARIAGDLLTPGTDLRQMVVVSGG
ncbi:AHH domain-containing protein [Corallococcus coralloides]|nr:AHH domain-containing protein [Corallococcus coralloides]